MVSSKLNTDPVEPLARYSVAGANANDGHNLEVVMGTDFYRALYNAMVFEYPNKKRIPVVYDLDFRSAVVGYELFQKGSFNNEQFNLLQYESALFATKFAVLRQKLPHAAMVQAIAFMKSRKDNLYQTVNISQVIAQTEVSFYENSNGTGSRLKIEPFSEEEPSLRPGTPVIVLGKKNGLLKVAILDINSDLQDKEKNVGYIKEDTKLSNVLPDELTGLIDQRSFGGGGA